MKRKMKPIFIFRKSRDGIDKWTWKQKHHDKRISTFDNSTKTIATILWTSISSRNLFDFYLISRIHEYYGIFNSIVKTEFYIFAQFCSKWLEQKKKRKKNVKIRIEWNLPLFRFECAAKWMNLQCSAVAIRGILRVGLHLSDWHVDLRKSIEIHR